MAGMISGSVISRKVWRRLAPSDIAASSIDALDADEARLHHQHDIGQRQHDVAEHQQPQGARLVGASA